MLDFILNPWTIGLSLSTVIVGSGALFAFVPGAAAFMLGTKAGRYIVISTIIIFIVLIFLSRVFSAGRAKEKTAQTEAALKALVSKLKSASEIQAMPIEQRKRELEKWSKD
jgi:uncharacterized membrane protein